MKNLYTVTLTRPKADAKDPHELDYKHVNVLASKPSAVLAVVAERFSEWTFDTLRCHVEEDLIIID